MIKKSKDSQITTKAPEDEEFPELKTLTHQEMYDLIGKFLQKAIPVKGAKLAIVNGIQNRTAPPKAPYVVLQLIEENRLSSSETRYTDRYKILWTRLQVSIGFTFIGSNTIPALEMANAFTLRFNDAWASEQFESYQEPFFPLYSDDVKNNQYIDAENQYVDCYAVTAHFEYHPEIGVCATSAKEVVMNVKTAE